MIGYATTIAAALAVTHPAASNRVEIAEITLDVLVVLSNSSAPFLSDRGWVIDGRIAANPRLELLRRAKETGNWDGKSFYGAAMVVSLGPQPTFGAFLRTVQSLREMGLCLVFIKEGGQEAGAFLSSNDVEMPGLRVC